MEISPLFLTIVPVIVGLVEVVKRIGLDNRYAPLLSVVLGCVGAYYFVGNEPIVLLQGMVSGLAACGLWSGVKTTLG